MFTSLLIALMNEQNRAVAAGEIYRVEDYRPVQFSYEVKLGVDGKVLDVVPFDRSKKGNGVFPAPYIERTAGVQAQLLWDNPEYLAGLGPRGEEQLASFRKMIALVQRSLGDQRFPALDALAALYAGDLTTLTERADFKPLAEWAEARAVAKSAEKSGQKVKPIASCNVLFSYLDQGPIFLIPGLDEHLVRSQLEALERGTPPTGTCSVTGQEGVLGDLHGKVYGVQGSPTTGGLLVSSNKNAFDSFGLKGSDNYPMLQRVARGYNRGLNKMLEDWQRRHIRLAHMSFVIWDDGGQRPDVADLIIGKFGKAEDEEDSNDALDKLRAILAPGKVWTGNIEAQPLDQAVHILGLRASSARIAVTDYRCDSARDFYEDAREWFEALDISGSEIFRRPTVRHLVNALSGLKLFAGGKKLDEWDIFQEQLIRASLLKGKISPKIQHAVEHGFAHTVHAVARDTNEDIRLSKYLYHLATLAKLILHRNYDRKDITVALDPTNTEIGYNIGRLLAVYERVQARALPFVANGVRRRFKGALDHPERMIEELTVLNFAHLEDMRRNNLKTGWYDKLTGQIFGNIGGPIPRVINEQQRSLLIVGYWHQRAAFFAKKDTGNSSADTDEADLAEADLTEAA
jgi:CRISPR-associated protein Csd1